MKKLSLLLVFILLLTGCTNSKTSFVPLGSDHLAGQWVVYNEPDVLNQPTDLYLSFDEDGSVYYWDTTEYGYVCTQFEGIYRYEADQNAMSVQLQMVEGGAAKGELFSVAQRWDITLPDQDTLQISVDLDRFAVGITMKEKSITFQRCKAYQYGSENVIQHKLPISPLDTTEYDPKAERNITVGEMVWGMSVDEVLNLYPNLAISESKRYTDVCDLVTYSGNGLVLGRNAEINVVFLKIGDKTFLCQAKAVFFGMSEDELLLFEKHVVNPHYLGYNIFFFDPDSRWDMTTLNDAEMEIYQFNQQYLKCVSMDDNQTILDAEMGIGSWNDESIYCIEIDAVNYLLSTMILQNK